MWSHHFVERKYLWKQLDKIVVVIVLNQPLTASHRYRIYRIIWLHSPPITSVYCYSGKKKKKIFAILSSRTLNQTHLLSPRYTSPQDKIRTDTM